MRGGQIVFDAGQSDCLIRFLSMEGANLEFDTLSGIPGTFALYFDDGSPARYCTVIWQIGATLAVQFRYRQMERKSCRRDAGRLD